MTTPAPATCDADWLRKLIVACELAMDRLPTDPRMIALHADIALLRADLQARVDELDTENAA
jgi:hypothetical protein